MAEGCGTGTWHDGGRSARGGSVYGGASWRVRLGESKRGTSTCDFCRGEHHTEYRYEMLRTWHYQNLTNLPVQVAGGVQTGLDWKQRAGEQETSTSTHQACTNLRMLQAFADTAPYLLHTAMTTCTLSTAHTLPHGEGIGGTCRCPRWLSTVPVPVPVHAAAAQTRWYLDLGQNLY